MFRSRGWTLFGKRGKPRSVEWRETLFHPTLRGSGVERLINIYGGEDILPSNHSRMLIDLHGYAHSGPLIWNEISRISVGWQTWISSPLPRTFSQLGQDKFCHTPKFHENSVWP